MGSAAVLVVDDEPLIRLSVVDALEDEGLEVLDASAADEALQVLLAGTDVAVLLTDVKMPGAMDGLDLVNHVAACWPEIAIFVMSGHAYADDPRIPEGATFLPKPFSLNQLVKDIRARAG